MRPFPVEPDPSILPASPEEIPLLIERILTERGAAAFDSDAGARLARTGAPAEEALLAALDDPRATWEEEHPEVGEAPMPPAARLASALWSIPSRRLGDKLLPICQRDIRWISYFAPRAVAALGRVDVLPQILTGLADPMVAFPYCQEGVDMGIRLGWAEPGFVRAIADWCRPSALGHGARGGVWVVKFYARHGGALALEELQGEYTLSTNNSKTIHGVLRELNRHSVVIPPSRLMPIVEKSLTSAEWPWNLSCRSALEALARTDAALALEIAQEHLARADDSVYERHSQIAEFIAGACGLPEIGNWYPPENMQLSEEELRVLEPLWVCRRACSDIITSWRCFVDECGDGCWAQVRSAFESLGASRALGALDQAIAILDPERIGFHPAKRPVLPETLTPETEERLHALQGEIYREQMTGVSATDYMLRHRDLFARIKRERTDAGMDRVDPAWDDGV